MLVTIVDTYNGNLIGVKSVRVFRSHVGQDRGERPWDAEEGGVRTACIDLAVARPRARAMPSNITLVLQQSDQEYEKKKRSSEVTHRSTIHHIHQHACG